MSININFNSFIEKHFCTKERKEEIIGNDFVKELLSNKKVDDSVKSLLRENQDKILFRFKNSFIVGESFIIGTSEKHGWKKIDFSKLKDIYFTTFNFGFFKSKDGYAIFDQHFDNYIQDPSSGKRWFKLFREHVENEIQKRQKTELEKSKKKSIL